jgi:antitoxin (DNA-binding transcriptional repressor) of toxin-antitoxin stability system
LLEKVRHGAEVIIEEDERPIAVLRAAPRSGRPISECIALAKARGSNATMDEDFARDVEEAIHIHNEPWKPPSSD